MRGGDGLAVVEQAVGRHLHGEIRLLRGRQVQRGFGPERHHGRSTRNDRLQNGAGDAREICGLQVHHHGVVPAGLHLGIHDHFREVKTRGGRGGGASIDDDFDVARRHRVELEGTGAIRQNLLAFQAEDIDLHPGDGQQIDGVGDHGPSVGADLQIVGGAREQIGAGINDAARDGGGRDRGDADGAKVEGELAARRAGARGIEQGGPAFQADGRAIDRDLHLRSAGHRICEEEPREGAVIRGHDGGGEFLPAEAGVEIGRAQRGGIDGLGEEDLRADGDADFARTGGGGVAADEEGLLEGPAQHRGIEREGAVVRDGEGVDARSRGRRSDVAEIDRALDDGGVRRGAGDGGGDAGGGGAGVGELRPHHIFEDGATDALFGDGLGGGDGELGFGGGEEVWYQL